MYGSVVCYLLWLGVGLSSVCLLEYDFLFDLIRLVNCGREEPLNFSAHTFVSSDPEICNSVPRKTEKLQRCDSVHHLACSSGGSRAMRGRSPSGSGDSRQTNKLLLNLV